MKIEKIFFNEFGRLRSGWRFAVFLLLFIFFGIVFGYVVEFLLTKLAVDFSEGSALYILVNGFVSFATALLIGWLCGKYFESLPFRALGCWFTKNWLKDLVLGLALGAIALLTAAFIAFVFGGLSFQFNQTHGQSAILLTLGVSLIVFIAGAAFEEMLFRGYIFQTLARANLAWLAIALTSVFFAVAHLTNSNANYISTFNTALAGVWFGIAYLKTRTLWFVFGLHLAWNWFQGAIFGIEVSGIKSLTTAPLFQEIDSGPIWLTGESYGIEGGIACTFALIVSVLLIWFLPFLKPTEEMLALTSKEKFKDTETRKREDAETF
jgi:membrane protease YdiL (CAAX protease family)